MATSKDKELLQGPRGDVQLQHSPRVADGQGHCVYDHRYKKPTNLWTTISCWKLETDNLG
jgi:hypothetical protein